MTRSITFNNNTINITDDTVSILDSLEKHDVKIESQCRDGFCGACRCKLLEGEIEYVKTTLAYVADGEVLTCSAVPKTDIKLST